MEYKIISSGSKGNCVTINKKIMVDCGVSFKDIKNDLYDVKYLLLTHIHSDHIKFNTFQMILKKFPKITIIGNYEVHNQFNCNIIANEGFEIVTEDYIFYPFLCDHDVLTYGFTFSIDGKEIIYCTDTGSLKNAPVKKYDYFFLESNHDEQKLEAARNEYKGSYNPYLSGKRHLSTQAAKSFFYTNRRSKESELIELHKSQRFY